MRLKRKVKYHYPMVEYSKYPGNSWIQRESMKQSGRNNSLIIVASYPTNVGT